jgi:L-ascorbate metabolism protein UlaG (beta-lactamase superfamily)
MRIRKYIHSCLLVESNGTRLLFDPGKFTFADGTVGTDTFRDLDAIVITHPHLDHMDPPSIRTIVANSPRAVVLGNAEIRAQLADTGVTVEVFESGTRQIGSTTIEAIPAAHAKLLNAEAPANVAYVVEGRLLHPGDSFDTSIDKHKGIDLLALPVMAPWTTELSVAEFAQRLSPKTVFPIHDGYAKDFFLASRYDNYGKYFAKHGIEFVPMKEPGSTLER